MPVNRCILFVIIVAILGIGAGIYLTYELLTTKEALSQATAQNTTLTSALADTEGQLTNANDTVAALTNELDLTAEELDELKDDYRAERDRNEAFENQIDRLTDTVGVLDKLSKTDEELLQKYSRVYFLNENYIPSDLDEIDGTYVHESKDDEYFHADALPFLESMLYEAYRDEVDITIVSAYRSFDEQRDVKHAHTVVYGEGANTFSADQGYSEHQLGTTVDFGTEAVPNARAEFANTEAYTWLLKNAYKYGFILSYPEGNTFYDYEPWHWRFVGRDLARDLHRDEANFYDWEQREIDEYLINIFD